MNNNDFRFIYRGVPIRALAASDAGLLAPIDIRSSKHQRALLLLHGFSSTPGVYRLLVPQLHHYDAIVCPVLPGHAQSIAQFSQTSAEDWLTNANQTCADLCANYQQVDVLGLSLGGLLACHVAQHHPLHHLYLLAPALALTLNIPRTLWFTKLCYRLGFRYLRNRAGNLHQSTHYELTYRQLPLTMIIAMLDLIQHPPLLPTECPVDLFLGRYDAVVDSKVIAKQFASLTNTNIHWLEHSAHILPLDGDLEAIVRCMQSN